jgi:hypothetical protein
VYQFTNPTNGITYLLAVTDNGQALKAYKPQSPQNFTLLKRQQPAMPQTAGKCKADEVPVQNPEALDPNLHRLFGVRAIPGVNLQGTFLNEGKGSPIVELHPDGKGVFEMHGAPKPEHVYAVRWWIQANCDGSLVEKTYPRAKQYMLIVEFVDRPYQGKRFDRIGLSVQHDPGDKMFIFERFKSKT